MEIYGHTFIKHKPRFEEDWCHVIVYKLHRLLKSPKIRGGGGERQYILLYLILPIKYGAISVKYISFFLINMKYKHESGRSQISYIF
jgi:hypothetical protein